MALTIASDIAVAACHRAAAAVRTVRRAVVRRSDAWLYGLDQQYPEYDAYHRRPRRIARAVGVTVVAAESVAVATVGLCGVLANRWAQRPNSDRRSVTTHRGPAGAVHRPGARGRTGRAHRVRRRDVDPASRTDLPGSSGSDVSDPPVSVVARPPIPAESTVAALPGPDGDAANATTPDTRHTSAIPSTFAPGAA